MAKAPRLWLERGMQQEQMAAEGISNAPSLRRRHPHQGATRVPGLVCLASGNLSCLRRKTFRTARDRGHHLLDDIFHWWSGQDSNGTRKMNISMENANGNPRPKPKTVCWPVLTRNSELWFSISDKWLTALTYFRGSWRCRGWPYPCWSPWCLSRRCLSPLEWRIVFAVECWQSLMSEDDRIWPKCFIHTM